MDPTPSPQARFVLLYGPGGNGKSTLATSIDIALPGIVAKIYMSGLINRLTVRAEEYHLVWFRHL